MKKARQNLFKIVYCALFSLTLFNDGSVL